MGPLKINLSQAFAGQSVSVMRYDLGFFDHETSRIESADNPFAAKLFPMSPAAGINRHPSLRNGQNRFGSGGPIWTYFQPRGRESGWPRRLCQWLTELSRRRHHIRLCGYTMRLESTVFCPAGTS
jgi:hypothetical protein